MIDFIIPKELKPLAYDYIKSVNVAQRGIGDGNKYHQYAGILGQFVVCDRFGYPFPDPKNGFDGGYDIEVKGKKVDIKTKIRNVDVVLENYAHNILYFQKDYPVDFYLFCSVNVQTSRFFICGMISKNQFYEVAALCGPDDVIVRDDGERMRFEHKFFECYQRDLIDIYDKSQFEFYCENWVYHRFKIQEKGGE